MRAEKIQEDGRPEEQDRQPREIRGQDGERPERSAQTIGMPHTPGDHLPHIHDPYLGKEEDVGVGAECEVALREGVEDGIAGEEHREGAGEKGIAKRPCERWAAMTSWNVKSSNARKR